MIPDDLRMSVENNIDEFAKDVNPVVGVLVEGSVTALGIAIYSLHSGWVGSAGIVIALIGVWGLVGYFR